MSTVTAVPLQPVKRGYLVWLWAGIVAAVIGAAALAWAGQTGLVAMPTGLKYKVLVAAKPGPHPTDSDVALINYVGKLTDGSTFDQSRQPTPMPVAGVVPGFSQALKLMPKGAKYRFWIPPQLGYGAQGAGPIPPDATLVFDVELIDFIPAEAFRQMQAQQMMRRGGAAMPGAMPGQGAPPTP